MSVPSADMICGCAFIAQHLRRRCQWITSPSSRDYAKYASFFL